MLFAFFIVKQKIERKKKCAGSSTEHIRFVIGTSKIRTYEDKSVGAHFIEINVRRHHHHQLLSSRDPLFSIEGKKN